MPQIVQKTLNTAHSEEFVARHRTDERAFTRNRKLSFFNLLLFLLNQIKGSIQEELDAFVREGDQTQAEVVSISKAAFTKARRFLKPSAFIELNRQLVSRLEAEHRLATWKGLRLLAVDGSKVTVPNTLAVRAHFGGQNNAYGTTAQALMSQCYDVLNGLSLDVEVSPYKGSEQALAYLHLQRISGDNLFLYDRGYPATWLMAAHHERGQSFCMRMQTKGRYRCVEDFTASSDTDTTVELRMGKEALAHCKRYDIHTRTLRVRLIKVLLPSGDIEVLATNLLNTARYPHSEFKALYHKRWGVEEDYKHHKHSLKLEMFSGKTVHAVLQDVHAKALTKNITQIATLGTEARVKEISTERKHDYQVNFKQALSKTKFTLIKIAKASRPEVWVHYLVDQIVRCLEAVRPGRHFPRKRPVGSRTAVSGTYKPIR